MVEPQEIRAQFRGAPLGGGVVLRPDEKTAARPLVGRIRQRQRRRHLAIASEQRSTAFVGIRFGAMSVNGPLDTWPKRQRRRAAFLPEAIGKVLLTAVAEDDDDHRIRSAARNTKGTCEVRP